MEKSTFLRDSYHPLSSSHRDVRYSCGSCGFDLNLSSSNRNTSTIGSSKYNKLIKRGIISFLSIDESRFNQVDELQCKPFFSSKRTWGLLRHRSKLCCRKCGIHIGNASDDNSNPVNNWDGSDSTSGSEASSRRKYDIKIRALQPSSSDEETQISLYT